MKEHICSSETCNNVYYKYKIGQKYCCPRCLFDNKKDKKKGSINPVSKKRLTELSTYRGVRTNYLDNNKLCEVKECSNGSTHIHHKAGRLGAMLYDSEFFMAVCNSCHPKKIHENPKWSRENGYIV